MTNVNPETQETFDADANADANAAPAAAAGLPLRGLAMVLIAVAVMLGLWGLYSFTQDDSEQAAQDTQTTAPGDSSSADANAPAPGQGAEGQQGQQGQDGQPGQEGQDGQDGQRPEASAPAPDVIGGPAEGDNNAEGNRDNNQPGNAGAPAAGEGPKQVNVLNNSMEAGLADRVAGDLERQDYTKGYVGNFNAENLSETTVFFPAGDKAAEAEARALADKLGGIARENTDNVIRTLEQENANPRVLTVVLTAP